MMTRILALAGLATALTVTALSITPSAAAPRDTNPYRCMIDEGYGRVHPCSQGYQQGSWNGPQPSPVTPQR